MHAYKGSVIGASRGESVDGGEFGKGRASVSASLIQFRKRASRFRQSPSVTPSPLLSIGGATNALRTIATIATTASLVALACSAAIVGDMGILSPLDASLITSRFAVQFSP